MSWGCLDSNGRCPDDVCNELGVWAVSRGCKEGLKQVLTIWCPNLSFGKGHLVKGNFEGLGCQDCVWRVSRVHLEGV